MEKQIPSSTTHRRGFLGMLATGAATTIGLTTLATPFRTYATPTENASDPDAWFSTINGKHRIVFDVPSPHEMFPFAWPKVFLLTNQATGSTEKDCSVVVILRHNAIPYAFEDKVWDKYKFGEHFKIDDMGTKTPSTKNAFWKPKPGAFKIPGFGEVAMGINELQASGVMFCVCDAAITVNSAVMAQMKNMDAAETKKDWLAGLLPGVQVVPSGVWAVGRAQEHGCAYCFVG